MNVFSIEAKKHIRKPNIVIFFSTFFNIDKKNIILESDYWSLDHSLLKNYIGINIIYLKAGLKTMVDFCLWEGMSNYKFFLMAGQMANNLKTDVVIGDIFYEDKTAQDRILLITPEYNVLRGISYCHDEINDVVLDNNLAA